MIEKSCKTCKYYNGKCNTNGTECIKDNYSFSAWQQKEEKMRKPIFESEEEFIDLMFRITGVHYGTIDMANYITKAKALDIIKKSPVEEAEEMYKNYDTHRSFSHVIPVKDIIEKQYEAIQYLKKQLKKKENGNVEER